MLKASENFKLLKYVVIEGNPNFLIEHQGQEYISFFDVFMRNTADNRRQLTKDRGYRDAYEYRFKRIFDSPRVSGWEVVKNGYCCFWGCPLEIGHWDIDLPNLEDAVSMFYGCETLTRFSGNLDSLERGDGMFNCSGLNSFESALPSLRCGYEMFEGCRNLSAFDISLPVLERGESMFADCENLTVFSGSLPRLKCGLFMFQKCHTLTTFSSTLPRLKDGWCMFKGCRSLTAFDIPLPRLEDGVSMFRGCRSLITFDIPLPYLKNGKCMFMSCNLTNFNSSLPQLLNGESMFKDSYLKNFNSMIPNLDTACDSMFENTPFARHLEICLKCTWD